MSDPKRTLFVDGRWLAQPGQGVYTYFVELYSRIVRRDVPGLELVFGLLPGHAPDFLPARSRVLTYRSDAFLWRQLALGRHINRLKPDFVHFQYTLPWGLGRDIHTIVALHDVIFLEHPELFSTSYRLSRQFFFGRSARKADTLLTISEQSRRDIQKQFDLGPERVQVIPLGAGSRLKDVAPDPVMSLRDEQFFLAVGRHEPRKNYKRLVEAFESASLYGRRGIRLVIAGWIAEEFKLQAVGESDGVCLLTECTDAQLAWLYGNARGFVFPSIAEGYGLPLVEALEFGLPCITSNSHPIDAVREACVSQFDPLSSSEIAAALETLGTIDKSQDRGDLRVPSWDDYADRFLEVVMTAPLRESSR
jgi:glycosyltransferase involved in cell wall biosynthesis